jgi:uncharacterized protein HemY
MWLRWVLLLLFLLAVGCFVAYMVTGRVGYRRWGLVIFKWTVFAGLGFFAVLAVQRLL